MAESKEPKPGRSQKRREAQQAKGERTGDTPQAEAERRGQDKRHQEYDADQMKNRVGNPGAALLGGT